MIEIENKTVNEDQFFNPYDLVFIEALKSGGCRLTIKNTVLANYHDDRTAKAIAELVEEYKNK